MSKEVDELSYSVEGNFLSQLQDVTFTFTLTRATDLSITLSPNSYSRQGFNSWYRFTEDGQRHAVRTEFPRKAMLDQLAKSWDPLKLALIGPAFAEELAGCIEAVGRAIVPRYHEQSLTNQWRGQADLKALITPILAKTLASMRELVKDD